MTFKRFLITFMSMTLAFSVLSITVSAKNRQDNTVQPMYKIAQSPQSNLTCIGSNATCCSTTTGTKVSSITATQTLQRCQDSAWTAVDGASWTSTVSTSSIYIQNSKSDLTSGTYRLKTVFKLTDKDGKTETVTVYSEEKTVT